MTIGYYATKQSFLSFSLVAAPNKIADSSVFRKKPIVLAISTCSHTTRVPPLSFSLFPLPPSPTPPVLPPLPLLLPLPPPLQRTAFSSRPSHFVPTAPHATTNPAAHAPSTSTSTQQPLPLPLPATTLAASPALRRGAVPQSPFRNKAANSLQRPLRHLSAARLWNPTNSSRSLVSSSSSRTPPASTYHLRNPSGSANTYHSRNSSGPANTYHSRTPSGPKNTQHSRTPSGPKNTYRSRVRAPSSPPPPNIPLSHPALHASEPVDNNDPIGTGAGDYPLLTLPEQRQIRHATSPRASLQVERAGSEKRISLPRSLRHSYDSKRLSPSPSFPPEEPTEQTDQTDQQQDPFGLSFNTEPTTKLDKGKGKAIDMPASHDNAAEAGRDYSTDLERGPAVLESPMANRNSRNSMPNRDSTASMPDGIGSAISSSNSSIMGDPEVQPGDMMGGEEWGPQHPCFPHRNPHVSIDDPAYISTRIIRIRRDWLIMGDLAPTFSNLYPEILDPAGMSEQEFRRVVDKLNRELTEVFSPWSLRNVVDGVIGLVTGWLWEDLGMTAAKGRLARLEAWLEQWNDEMARNAEEGGPAPPKIIPLRQTGYMTLDIQIGDPEIAPAPPSTPARSHHGIEVTV